jgi:hypothetical protein
LRREQQRLMSPLSGDKAFFNANAKVLVPRSNVFASKTEGNARRHAIVTASAA